MIKRQSLGNPEEGIPFLDQNRRVVAINEAASRMLGQAPATNSAPAFSRECYACVKLKKKGIARSRTMPRREEKFRDFKQREE